MPRVPGCDAVYEVANQWRDRCMVHDGSLLWPDLDEPTWTTAALREFDEAFIRNPDTSDKSFPEKLRTQLAACSDRVVRIAADTLAVYYLFPIETKANAKFSLIDEVISFRPQPVPKIDLLEQAFEHGIGKAGAWYNTGRYWHVAFFAKFAELLKEANADPNNYEAVKKIADQALVDSKRNVSATRNMLVHLLFPDQTESISSDKMRREIVKALGDPHASGDDLDEELRQIRKQLTPKFGPGHFNFYDPEIKALWEKSATPAKRYWIFQSNPGKYDLAADLPTMELGAEDSWNVAQHRGEMNIGDKVAFWVSGKSGGLMAIGELSSAVYEGEKFDSPGEPGYRVKWKLVQKIDPIITREQMEANPLLAEMSPIAPPHQATNFPVTPKQWAEIMSLIGATHHKTPMPSTLSEFADFVYMDPHPLHEIESLIRDKKQIIFEGPPGSGKTYVARLFARYLAGLPLEGGPNEHVEIVQFHQSYGYEDFVAGIRPVTSENGTLTYETKPGVFIEMCRRASANPNDTYVLIIDEINRGNLSRIFGELLYGLEYRDQPVRMQYPVQWGDEFIQHLTIPDNLLLIGTMNSTDRSLAMIDYALRRRFYFWRLLPVESGQAPVLERWLDAQSDLGPADRAWILNAFIGLNREIGQQLGADYQIGHSYFMVNDGQLADPATMERVWRYAIEPLLREYFHARHDAEERIEALRSHVFAMPEPIDSDYDEDDSES